MNHRFSQFLPETIADGARRPTVDVADLVTESVAVFDLDLRVTAWNRGAERLYGWKRESVIGGKIQAAVRCSPSEPLASILAKVHATGTWQGSFTRTTSAGSLVHVDANWALRRTENGDPVDIVETSRDMTELRRTSEALRRAQHQYQNMFHASVASFWELDFSEVGEIVRSVLATGVKDIRTYLHERPDEIRRLIRGTRVLDMNDVSANLFGFAHGEHPENALEPLWPEESFNVFADSVVAAFERRAHFSSEVVLRSRDGRRYDTVFTVSFPDVALRTARILVGIIDMTEAKRAQQAQARSEQRYSDFFQFLPVALCRVDGSGLVGVMMEARAAGVVDFARYLEERPDVYRRATEGLKIVDANPRMIKLLGGERAEHILGRTVTQYWTEAADVLRASLGVRYAGGSGYEGQIKLRIGEDKLVDAFYFGAFGAITGDPTMSLIGLIDVSDRVRAQAELVRLQADVAHASRIAVLGELTASIAHEVSQPLTAIQTNTEASLLWLGREPPNVTEVRNLASHTAAQVQRAADILQRIRSMATRKAPEPALVDLRQITREAVLLISHELERHGVITLLRFADDAAFAYGDRIQIQQVIVNLAVNAIQAMANSADSRRLTITGSRLDGATVTLAIEDSGPGIATDAMGLLFQSFFTTKSGGMGIGLAICRSIIETHGGRITLTNRAEARGARAAFTLPTQAPPPLRASDE